MSVLYARMRFALTLYACIHSQHESAARSGAPSSIYLSDESLLSLLERLRFLSFSLPMALSPRSRTLRALVTSSWVQF